jgi:hypothetical protein
MLLDQENLRPVIIAMALYLTIATLIPRIIKKPTGVKILDDIVMALIAERGSLMSHTIILGIVVLGTNYIHEEFM